MHKLLCLLIILFSTIVFAKMPDIVALVNDKPITKYDLETRKQMAIVLNNIDNSALSLDAKLNVNILNILIEEELLNQHAKKVGGVVREQEIDDAIRAIEQRNNMLKGKMYNYLGEKNVDMESFRKQIKGELFKYNIINSLSSTISISPLELDVAVVDSGKQNFDVEGWIFTSKKSADKDLKNMQLLKKHLISCNKITDKLYVDFANGEKFDKNFLKMPIKTQSVLLDTKIASSSSIYKEDNKFKMVFVCKKNINVSSIDLNKFKSFLLNKKMSQEATRFFKDLRSKAYIRVLISG